jgi:hypothetical protein
VLPSFVLQRYENFFNFQTVIIIYL